MLRVLSDIFKGKWPPFRMMLRRYGILRILLVITFIAILLSELISISITLKTTGYLIIWDILVPIIIPVIVVPILVYHMLHTVLELDLMEEKLKIISITDELTGAYNRRYFTNIANQELARTQRYGGTFSIAILDFDDFKNINDTYGHLAGDQVLVQVAKICNANIRSPDIFARYGGDEFILLFPQTNKEKAINCLNRILEDASRKVIQYENLKIKIEFSVGLAEFSSTVLLVDDILREADMALYNAKRTGKNKIVSSIKTG